MQQSHEGGDTYDDDGAADYAADDDGNELMIRSMMKMFLLQNFIVDLQKRPDDLSDDDVDDQYDADTRKMLI